MIKQELIRDMKQFVGGASFINSSQLAKYLKRSRNSMPELLYGLDYLASGRERKYFILDVAGRLMDERKC